MILDQSVLGVEKYTPHNEDFDWADQYSLIKLSYEATLEADREILNSILNENEVINEFGLGKKEGFDIGRLFSNILKFLLKAIVRIFTAFLNLIVKIFNAGKITSRIQIDRYEQKIRDFRGKIIMHTYRSYDPIDSIELDPNIKQYFEPFLYDKYNELENLILRERSPEILESSIKELEERFDSELELKKFLNHLVNIRFEDTSLDNYKNTLIDKLYGPSLRDKTLSGNEIHSKFFSIYKDSNKLIRKLEKEKKSIERSTDKAVREANSKFDNNKLFKFLEKSPRTTNKVKSATVNYERKILSTIQKEAAYVTTFYGVKLQGYKDREAQARKVLVATIQKIIQEEGDQFVDKVFD